MNFIKQTTMLFIESTIAAKANELTQWILKVFALILLLIEDLKLVMIAVPILVILNQITGVWKARKQKEFNWKKFNMLYTKLILYFIAIMATFVYEHYILGITTDHYFSKGLAAVMGFQELSSSYKNITFIIGKDFINKYLQKLKI